jgi:hypothetical protein
MGEPLKHNVSWLRVQELKMRTFLKHYVPSDVLDAAVTVTPQESKAFGERRLSVRRARAFVP